MPDLREAARTFLSAWEDRYDNCDPQIQESADVLRAALDAEPGWVSVNEWRECVEGLAWQFGIRGVKSGKPCIHSGCLSDMGRAFAMLGWDDPHFLTEEEQDGVVCEVDGCAEPATSGQRWGDLYLRLCRVHGQAAFQEEERPPIKQRAIDREATRDPATGVLPTPPKDGGR